MNSQAKFMPFTAQTRMSGVDLHANGARSDNAHRKGAAEAVRILSNQLAEFFRKRWRTRSTRSRARRHAAGRRVGHA